MRLAARLVSRLPAATLLLLLPLAACSVLVDTSGLATDVAASGDASPGPIDATIADSKPLADGMATADGNVPFDAADAGMDASDSNAPTCTPSATTVCDDFDDSQGLPAGWQQTIDRGTMRFDAVGLSLPHALETKVGAGSGTGDSCLTRTYPSTRTNIRCEFDMKLVVAPTTNELDILDFITVVPGTGEYHVYVGSFSGAWSAAEYQGSSDGGDAPIDRTVNLPDSPPPNTWFHISFEQAGTTATLTANGSTIVLNGLTLPPGTTTSLNIGLTYVAGQIQSADMLFDNIACTVLP